MQKKAIQTPNSYQTTTIKLNFSPLFHHRIRKYSLHQHNNKPHYFHTHTHAQQNYMITSVRVAVAKRVPLFPRPLFSRFSRIFRQIYGRRPFESLTFPSDNSFRIGTRYASTNNAIYQRRVDRQPATFNISPTLLVRRRLDSFVKI